MDTEDVARGFQAMSMTRSLAERVEEWLFREDLKQSQLARRARLAEATLSRVLAGKQTAGPRVLRKLERAMDLEIGALEQ